MPEPHELAALGALTRFEEGLPTVHPLPPAEVRRRGDRRRRRTTALIAAGAAAAVVVAIAAPLSVLAAAGDHSEEPADPSPSAPVHWPQRVPAAFPLSADLRGARAATETDPGRPETADLVPVCGDYGWPLTDSVDAATAGYRGESDQGAVQRTLAVYRDESSARAALGSLRSTVRACSPGTDRVTRIDLGTDESFAWAEVVETNLFSHHLLIEVARSGNALLLVSASVEGGAQAPASDQAAWLRQSSSQVLAAMCAFADSPCPLG